MARKKNPPEWYAVRILNEGFVPRFVGQRAVRWSAGVPDQVNCSGMEFVADDKEGIFLTSNLDDAKTVARLTQAGLSRAYTVTVVQMVQRLATEWREA